MVLVLSTRGDLKLSVYVDANDADKANGECSASVVVVMLAGTGVSASSTTQRYVALSTSEAECVVMAHTVPKDGFVL